MQRMRLLGSILVVVIATVGFSNTALGNGACCDNATGECIPVADQAACDLVAGSYQGDGTECTAPKACCLPDGSCANLDPLCCVDQGGISNDTGTCLGDSNNDGIDDFCQNKAVPALTPWGYGVLALVLVGGAAIAIRRRTRTA